MVIILKQKQDILLKYFRDGQSQRSIAREVGVDKKTVSSYIKNYERKLEKVLDQNGPLEKGELIQSLIDSPKYTSSTRKKRVLTDEIREGSRLLQPPIIVVDQTLAVSHRNC